MGAADCITAVMSYAQQYNTHNMHIKTQPHKHICIPIYKHKINKREPKANSNYRKSFSELFKNYAKPIQHQTSFALVNLGHAITAVVFLA